MPAVKQQVSTTIPSRQVAVANGSVSHNQAAIDFFLKMLVYGQSGSGKTTFATTLPGKSLWLVCSGSTKPGELLSVDPEDMVRITPKIVNTMDQLDEYLKDVDGYDNIILDHVSGLQDISLREILHVDELPAKKSFGMANRKEWGLSAQICCEPVRKMLGMDKNIVIIGQERDNKKDDSEASVELDMESPTVGCGITPGFAKWLNPAVSYITQCFKRGRTVPGKEKTLNGKTVQMPPTRVRGVDFCMRIGQHGTITTKFRVPKKLSIAMAESGVDYITNPDYFKVLAAIRGDFEFAKT